MKHTNASWLPAQKNRADRQLLIAIKEMIKTPSLRKEGFEKLQAVDAEILSVDNQVYYYYIKGKYYVLEFKASKGKDVELLNYANDSYSDMVAIAYDNNFPIKEAKRHFMRAYCKYLIAINQSSAEVKAKLFKKADQIIGRVLCYDADNDSCLWLQSQLQNA